MEGNKAIELKNLQTGDEVLISGNNLRYFTILRGPTLRSIPSGYRAGTYKAIKVKETYKHFFGYKNPVDREVYFDFNYSNIWLIKRKDEYEN